MFIFELPYSKQNFEVTTLKFKNIFDISRLIYDDNDLGLVEYFNNVFNIKYLNVIDKFFILFKMRELFVDENVALTHQGNSINVPIKLLLKSFNDLPSLYKKYTVNDIVISFDVPCDFFSKNTSTDIFTSVIDRIFLDDIVINFREISLSDKNKILENLPINAFNCIKDYLLNTGVVINLLENITRFEEKIEVNFFSDAPFAFIKALYSDYHISSCREILFHLSKRMGSDTLLNSTMNDIQFYLDEYSNELKQNTSSNPLGIL